MNVSRTVTVLVLPLVLSACPQPDAEPPPPAQPVADAPAPPTTDPLAPGQFALQPLGGSGIVGEASVAEEAGRSRVSLSIQGGEPGVRYQSNILTGTCADPGGGVADLDLFFVDQLGVGSSSAVASIAASTLRATPHVVVVQHPLRETDPIVACGQIPGSPTGPT